MQAIAQTNLEDFVSVRISCVPVGTTLPFPIYVEVNQRKTLLRTEGDMLTPERVDQLREHGVGELFLLESDTSKLKDCMADIVADRSVPFAIRGQLLNEAGYLCVERIMGAESLEEVLPDVRDYVLQMHSVIRGAPELAKKLVSLSTHESVIYNHLVDTAIYAMLISEVSGMRDPVECGVAGMLHDIGEKKIDWKVVTKQERLTQREVQELKNHTTYGEDIVREIPDITEGVRRAVLEHHENYDGTGYPNALEGKNLHPISCIVAIADVFDALTTSHVYRKAIDAKSALELMQSMQPSRFHPELFDVFFKQMKALIRG